MKKKSRFLTGLLSAVMALSLFALPAAADNVVGGNGTENASAVTDVWGNEQSGSITIHKYEYNRPDGKEGAPATGAVLENNDIPEGAKALQGAKFQIFKVQNRAALAEYYSGKDFTGNANYENFTNVNRYYEKKSDGTFTVKNGDGVAVTGSDEKETNAQGEATFTIENKDFGLYLVVETYAPDKVKEKQVPFLVSVPMQDPSDRTAWLYNVHVYPKNATQYGDVKIKKVGITGSDEEVTLDGVTFELYKKEGDKWVPVTTRDDDATKALDLTTNGSGMISIGGLSKGEYKLVEKKFEGAEGNKGYIISEEPIPFTIGEDGGMTTSKDTDSDGNIVVKNYRPDLDKKVYNDAVISDKNDGYVDGSDYSVGDMVPYQITVKIPQNITKLKVFTVTDSPVNLEDQKNTIVITDITGKKTVDAEDKASSKTIYTVTNNTENTNGFVIKFDPANMKNYAGHTLVISYKAKLLDTAKKTTEGNKNNATLTYTNKIDETGEGKKDSKNTIENETVVYTFAIRIFKVGENDTPLAGAKFNLYKKLEAGETAPEDATTVTGDDAAKLGLDSKYNWVLVEEGLESQEGTGLVTTTKGLANGTYYLVETQAPAGYNLLAKPVEVTVNVVYKHTWKATDKYDENGNLVKHEVKETQETFNKAENAKDTNAKIVGEEDGEKVEDVTTGLKEIKVINRKGPTLPVTGGFGTLLFSCIGALLVVGGVGVLMSTKKKKGNT